jgi:hypothetical protein
MRITKVVVFSLTSVLFLCSLTACGASAVTSFTGFPAVTTQNQTTEIPLITTLVPSKTTVIFPETGFPIATEQNDPVRIYMGISPSPVKGENANCRLTVEIKQKWSGSWRGGFYDDLAKAKAWITIARAGISGSYSEARQYFDVPLDAVIVGGVTSWAGNALENGTFYIECIICLPTDGIWVFTSHFAGENWQQTLGSSQYVAVADGTSMPYYSIDLESSPIAYLEYFRYGNSGVIPPGEKNPLSLEIDLTRPPLAGEEATLTYTVNSPFYDIAGFKVKTEFVKKNAANQVIIVPASDIVISSELEWETNVFGQKYWPDWNTDLETVKSKILSTTIQLPEPGKWIISIHGEGLLPNGKYAISEDEIKITITETKAYYGWED